MSDHYATDDRPTIVLSGRVTCILACGTVADMHGIVQKQDVEAPRQVASCICLQGRGNIWQQGLKRSNL